MLLLIFLTALKKCAAQTIIDDDVLKYLLGRSAKAYYMEKDIKLCDSTLYYQQSIVALKDSIILGQSESFRMSQFENELCNVELKSSQNEKKKLHKKISFFKFTTISTAIIGSISTLYFLIH